MSKFHLYTRITIALVGALVMSEFLIQDVFVASTPRVRPDLADHLVTQTLALVNIDNYIAFFRGNKNNTTLVASNENDAKEKLKKVPFGPTLIKGVYAKEIENASVIEIRVPEIDWVPVSYTKVNGEVVQLYIPRGEEPPPPGLF